ncbi:hypothetical protein ABZ747_33715 [Kitasatospora cineracea]|uniref:hypothetical protein n=1 Tax=Kitasatospora cineracea TaxID=88074 RepID=UPI0033EEE75D
MSGSEQQALQPEESSPPEAEQASADREVRHYERPARPVSMLQKSGVVLDFTFKLATTLAGAVNALKALGLM